MNEHNNIPQESKGEKFMSFLQVLTGISFMIGTFITLSPYLKVLYNVVKFIILVIITVGTGFLILIWDKFRAYWKSFLNNLDDVSESFFNNGIYFFLASIGLAAVVVIFFLISKKVYKKGQKIIFPIVIAVLSIIGIIVHGVISKSFYPEALPFYLIR